jgi:hypothetical protein
VRRPTAATLIALALSAPVAGCGDRARGASPADAPALHGRDVERRGTELRGLVSERAAGTLAGADVRERAQRLWRDLHRARDELEIRVPFGTPGREPVDRAAKALERAARAVAEGSDPDEHLTAASTELRRAADELQRVVRDPTARAAAERLVNGLEPPS